MLLCQFILAPVIIATPLIDEHQAILEEAKKEPLIPSQQTRIHWRGYAHQSHPICWKPQQLQASHARWFCEAVDESKSKSGGEP